MRAQPLESIPPGAFDGAFAHSFAPGVAGLQHISADLFESTGLHHHFEESQDFLEEPKSDL